MTNDDTAFREVDQALAEDRQWDYFRTHGPLVIGGAAAIVLAVGGWQVWSAQRNAKAEQAALEFSTAVETLAATPDDGRVALEALAETAPSGYSLLADMRRAGSLAASDRETALAIYRGIYANGAAPQRFRELARLRAASLSLADSREAVIADLGALPESSSEFGRYAQELIAIAALEAKDYETARAMFTRAAADPLTPEPVRLRAEEFAALAGAGQAGVNISGDATVDDLLEALETAADDGHDHGNEASEEETTPVQSQEAGGETGEEATVAAPDNEPTTGEDQ